MAYAGVDDDDHDYSSLTLYTRNAERREISAYAKTSHVGPSRYRAPANVICIQYVIRFCYIQYVIYI